MKQYYITAVTKSKPNEQKYIAEFENDEYFCAETEYNRVIENYLECVRIIEILQKEDKDYHDTNFPEWEWKDYVVMEDA